jgi:hypothetical protein
VEDEIVRKRIGLGLDQESWSFLGNFDSCLETRLEDLASVEEDVSRLQDALTEKDVMFLRNPFDSEGWDTSSPFATEVFPSESPFMAAIESATTALDFLRQDPLLLPMVDSKDGTGETRPEHDVNRRLLHRAADPYPKCEAISPREDLKRLRLDQERIKDLGLKWWYKDMSVTDFKSSRNIAALSIDLPAQPTSGYIPKPETSIDLTVGLRS